MVAPKAAANDEWFFQKVFGDGDFIAAGQLIIPPKSQKPSKGTKDNTYVCVALHYSSRCLMILEQVFYVIEGAVNLKVHETSLILATGGMFMVPRGDHTTIGHYLHRLINTFTGNTYYIENIADRDAKLFFTQARKIAAGEEEAGPYLQPLPGSGSRLSTDSQRRMSGGGRSSSLGVALDDSPSIRPKVAPVKRAASTKI